MLDHPALQPYFTAEHHRLRAAAAAFFRPERLADWRREPGGFIAKSCWHELGDAGFLGASLPSADGGQGLGLLGALILNEALGRLGDLGLSLGMHSHNEITSFWLATAHGPELKEKFLGEMIAGRQIGCAADTEIGAECVTRAVRDGDELVITGRKIYIVNGYHADLCFVTVRIDGEPSTVLVEKDRPGVSVLKVFDKFGTRAIDSALLEFDGVRVPVSHLARKRGVQQSMHWNKIMTTARFLMCADACFVHDALITSILDYGRARQVDGRPLLGWPLQRHAVARAVADRELMRAGLMAAFHKLQRKRNAVAEVAALKWFCVDRAVRFGARCAEMQGGAGYMHDSEYLAAHAQVLGLKMAGGSSTTMKRIADQSLAYQEELAAL